jgi:hypothetical protein
MKTGVAGVQEWEGGLSGPRMAIHALPCDEQFGSAWDFIRRQYLIQTVVICHPNSS